MPAPYPNTPSSFWSNTKPVRGGCIEWLGFRNNGGYGRLEFGGRKQLAHRVAWQLTNGRIPTGKIICHHCDNPPCVNPDHLFMGTHADNNWDGSRKGRLRRPKGSEHYHARLTEDAVRWLRSEAAAGASQRDLAVRCGVDPATVNHVLRGRSWRHVR